MTSGARDVERTDAPGELRRERDRFVALAFAAADVLFELDRDGRVRFGAGAADALLGLSPEALAGRPFLDLVVAGDRPMIAAALASAAEGARVNGLTCRLDGRLGPTPPLTMLGHQVPDLDGHFFLGLRLGAAASAPPPVSVGEAVSGVAPTESGLPDARAFAELAGGSLAALAAGDGARLSLLRLADLDALRARLDDEKRRTLGAAIGGVLRASAVGGALAGEIGSETYGVIHRPGTDPAALARRIAALALEADPERRGIGVSHAVVALDGAPAEPDEAARALGYIFTRYAESEADDFPLATLAEGLEAMVQDTRGRIAGLRGVLDTGAFDLAFQPVVDLATQRPHHFEALARFRHLPPGASPYETIVFAEQTGLIPELDLAMCARVLDWLERAGRQGQRYKVAVNLSGTSMASRPFVAALHRLLRARPEAAGAVIFEITESARIRDLAAVNASVQSLRHLGHKVCLDDFGAGAAAFQYLRALEVDVVKIDGAYVRGALESEKSMAFLRAMAGLCHDLGIATVAEMVEDRHSLAFLRACGIGYGQGFLFGRPSLDIGAFEAPRPSAFGAASRRAAEGE